MGSVKYILSILEINKSRHKSKISEAALKGERVSEINPLTSLPRLKMNN